IKIIKEIMLTKIHQIPKFSHNIKYPSLIFPNSNSPPPTPLQTLKPPIILNITTKTTQLITPTP
ncbi:hypothetical protein, partial [Bacillus mycoides]|uniref:hypothetical protein n=1 Tax=Bacillus mycoides TaxID=1405 RepID=UPI001C92E02E